MNVDKFRVPHLVDVFIKREHTVLARIQSV